MGMKTKIPQLEFYVYIHFRNDDGLPFYVGKGRANRAWRTDGRSVQWNRIVAKHGLRVEILKSNLSEVDAFALEKSTIFTLGRGFLCNHTDGGEGVAGWEPSNETKARMSAAQTGRKHSDAAKAKMGLSFKKAVYCSNGMKFDSAGDAAKFVSGKASVISRCAAGLRKSAYSLAWSYVDFPKCDLLEIDKVRRANQSKAKIGLPAKNRITVVRSDGLVYPSATGACDFMKTVGHPKAAVSAITACCRGKRKLAYGYSWKYEK